MIGRCGDCRHFIAYQPIGGWLPAIYRGHGSCYPDGTDKERGRCMQTADDDCTIDRFESQEYRP